MAIQAQANTVALPPYLVPPAVTPPRKGMTPDELDLQAYQNAALIHWQMEQAVDGEVSRLAWLQFCEELVAECGLAAINLEVRYLSSPLREGASVPSLARVETEYQLIREAWASVEFAPLFYYQIAVAAHLALKILGSARINILPSLLTELVHESAHMLYREGSRPDVVEVTR